MSYENISIDHYEVIVLSQYKSSLPTLPFPSVLARPQFFFVFLCWEPYGRKHIQFESANSNLVNSLSSLFRTLNHFPWIYHSVMQYPVEIALFSDNEYSPSSV